MPQWTLLGLRKARQTTPWPWRDGTDGQDGVLGMPRYEPDAVRATTAAPAPRSARPRRSPYAQAGTTRLEVDYGRCVVCQLCTEACPTGAHGPSNDWAFGVRARDDLVLGGQRHRRAGGGTEDAAASAAACTSATSMPAPATAASSELQALNNPFYNLHRLGIFFTASPRFADLLLVTGPVTHAMLRAAARDLRGDAGAALGDGGRHLRGLGRHRRRRLCLRQRARRRAAGRSSICPAARPTRRRSSRRC